MKIDILTHGNPKPQMDGLSSKFGGGVAFAGHLAKGFIKNKHDVKFVLGEANDLRNDADIILLSSIGVDKERNEIGENMAEMRMLNLKRSKAPIFVILHAVNEFRFFRHSGKLLKDLPLRGIIIMGVSKAIRNVISENMPRNIPVKIVPMPYNFNDGWFSDRSQFADTIVVPTRIAAVKGTHNVLSIAQRLPHIKFKVRGDRSGMYWGHNVRLHPHAEGENVEWIGGKGSTQNAYDRAAFSLDLTTLWHKTDLEGKRVQYTTLEAIDNGLIPITYDCWDDGSWEGTFLKSPIKNGNKIQLDIDACADAIDKTYYSFDMAKRNLSSLRSIHDSASVAKTLAKLFISS